MDFKSVMTAFADQYALAIDPKDGTVVLDFNAIPVSFMDAGDALVVHASLGESGPDTDAGLFHAMLAANAALADEGFAICQDPETEAFAIVRAVPLETLDAESLASLVAVLVTHATAWRQKLAEHQNMIFDS